MLCVCAFKAWTDLYRATPAVTQNLGFLRSRPKDQCYVVAFHDKQLSRSTRHSAVSVRRLPRWSFTETAECLVERG